MRLLCRQTCSLIGALGENLRGSEAWSSCSGSVLLLSLLNRCSTKQDENQESENDPAGEEADLPGHADIADLVSLIAAAGEALLNGPLRPVAAALSASRKWAPVHCRQPSTCHVLSSAGFYQLKKREFEKKLL